MLCATSPEARDALYALSHEYGVTGVGLVNPRFAFKLERLMMLLHAQGGSMSALHFSLCLQEWNLPRALADEAAELWQQSFCFGRR